MSKKKVTKKDEITLAKILLITAMISMIEKLIELLITITQWVRGY